MSVLLLFKCIPRAIFLAFLLLCFPLQNSDKTYSAGAVMRLESL